MLRTPVSAPSHESRVSVKEMAAWISSDVDAICAVLTDAIHEADDELDDDLRECTFQSCRANVAMIATMLGDEADPSLAMAPPEAVFYAREYARRRLGLDKLLAAYRFAHQRFIRLMVEHLEDSTPTVEGLSEATTFCSDWLFAWMDAVLKDVTGVYMEERERWVRTSAAIRAESVRAILDGRATDTRELSTRLNYDLQLRHVALVLWGAQDEDHPEAPDFERLATQIARRLGGTSWLLVPQGSLRLDAWVAVAGDVPDLGGRLDAAAKAGVRVAIGLPDSGIDGFRHSHEDALAAQRMARLTGRAAGTCTGFGDVMLSSLLTQDLARARRFAASELGGLATDDDASRRIASTLKVFLEEGSSFVGAARRIGVHENTVAYRVRRAVELLGRPLDDRKLEIHVALRLLEVLRRADA